MKNCTQRNEIVNERSRSETWFNKCRRNIIYLSRYTQIYSINTLNRKSKRLIYRCLQWKLKVMKKCELDFE